MTKQSASKGDDFSKKVKLDLGKRVNFRCSICDSHTVGPKAYSDTYKPRKGCAYKSCFTRWAMIRPRADSEERRAIANGIWACSRCADLIE